MKIGLAVITYNRPHYLKQCLEALDLNSWGGATERIIVVDEPDSDKYEWLTNSSEAGYEGEDATDPNAYWTFRRSGINNDSTPIFFRTNGGVASAKNKAVRELLRSGCNHIFLMEDDIIMKDDKTCMRYIEYASKTGVPHLNFGLHGPANRDGGYWINWNNQRIFVYRDCIGAFSYYTKEIIEEIGLIDENFKNAWEHVEWTYRLCKTGKIPEFWYFMDHPASELMLQEIPGSINHSSIRPRSDWAQNIREGQFYWMRKHKEWLPPRPE